MEESTGGQSLLDVIMSRENNLKDKTINTRVLYLGTKNKIFQSSTTKMKKNQNENEKGQSSSDVKKANLNIGGGYKDKNTSEIEMFHQQLFDKVSAELADFPYGLLYECKDYIIHILEGKSSNIIEFLRQLYFSTKQTECILSEVKILHYSDDIGNKLFPRWAFQNITGFTDEDEDEYQISSESDKEGIELIKLIYYTEQKLLNIGKRILGLRPQEMGIQLFSYLTHSPFLIPSPYSMSVLSQCEKCLTLSDFYELYCRPIDIKLDEEMIWPAKLPLNYIDTKKKKRKQLVKNQSFLDIQKMEMRNKEM